VSPAPRRKKAVRVTVPVDRTESGAAAVLRRGTSSDPGVGRGERLGVSSVGVESRIEDVEDSFTVNIPAGGAEHSIPGSCVRASDWSNPHCSTEPYPTAGLVIGGRTDGKTAYEGQTPA